MARGRHASGVTPREATERALLRAVLASFAAEVTALATGRVPWPSILVMIVCVSYLVEAVDTWRVSRAEAEQAELETLLDAEDAQLLQVA